MADTINTSMSATQMVGALNTFAQSEGLTPSPALSKDMSATDFATSVNGMLDTDVAISDSATTMVGKVNTGIDNYDPTPVEPLGTFKFLHVSDTHSGNDAITEIAGMLANDNSIDAVCHTGDITANVNALKNDTLSIRGKVLAVQGNHDAGDIFATDRVKDAAIARASMGLINRSDVVWNDNDTGCYWYKDFELSSNSKLRFIGIDQYNYTDGHTGTAQGRYTNVITQDQIDWFVDRITELRSTDYIIVMLHEVPLPATPSATTYRQSNLFCSSRLWTWDNNHGNCPDLWARIVNAYITSSAINLTTATDGLSVTVNEDFSGGTPAKFLFFLAGHTHGDFVGYHPTYSDVLILSIDTAQPGTGGRSSDLRSSDTPVEDSGSRNPNNGILLNQVTLDFVERTITIERIGHMQTAAHTIVTKDGVDKDDSHAVGYTYPAVTRDSLTLNFDRNEQD